MVVSNISKLHTSFSVYNHPRILTTFNTTRGLTMAASTPMNDDWEIVFIDEDGEVVSGKAPVVQSKPEVPIEIDIAPVAQSKQEVPIEIDILVKEMQLAEKEQKESTEREPAKPIQIQRPGPNCYRPTYAFKGSYPPAKDFGKQDAPDWSTYVFDPSRKVSTAFNEGSKVDRERAKFSQESKAWTAEQMKDYENSLFIWQQRCSAETPAPSV
jgi:hypothetical protein